MSTYINIGNGGFLSVRYGDKGNKPVVKQLVLPS